MTKFAFPIKPFTLDCADKKSPIILTLIKQTYFIFALNRKFLPAATLEPAPLKLIQIYFDTATYDVIEKDVKVTLEAQLGLIGGTMGLLTGFSLLSGVEIIYFAMKFFLTLRIPRAYLALKQKKKNTHLY